jgi:hypothetical protein
MATRSQIPVGVLTSLREQPTLESTLASLHAAGFASIMQFDDRHRIGCYAAWRKMLERMLWMFPDAPYLLMCEDDCEFSTGLADYLSSAGSAGDLPHAILSPYCAAANHIDGESGWHSVHPRRAFGALCYLIPRPLALQFHTRPPSPDWRDGTDIAMGQFCQSRNIGYYVHRPSLVRHTGFTTTLDIHKETDANDQFRQCEFFARRISADQGPLALWQRPGSARA